MALLPNISIVWLSVTHKGQKMDSLTIREFKYTLKNYVNNNSLPWEVKADILTSLAAVAQENADNEVAKELEEREKENE